MRDVTEAEPAIDSLRAAVGRAAPHGAVIAVVSRGDGALLDLGPYTAWHFPQRADGVYAGYYPSDTSAAVAHIETLIRRGAQFLAFPASSLWWLTYYDGLERYLDTFHRRAAENESSLVFELRGKHAGPSGASLVDAALPPRPPSEQREHALLALFDLDYYGKQAGRGFGTPREALDDYEKHEPRHALDPHPLFDSAWYLDEYPDARESGMAPLLHFIDHVLEPRDPNPYFDSGYYYSQKPELRAAGINALSHYVVWRGRGEAVNPNPFFENDYYLRETTVPASSMVTPLAHYLETGWQHGQTISRTHNGVLDDIRRQSRTSLLRGEWTNGTVLFFSSHAWSYSAVRELAGAFEHDYRVRSLVLAVHRPPDQGPRSDRTILIALDDYALAADLLRPAARRLVARALAAGGVLYAVSDDDLVRKAVEDAGVGLYIVPSAPSRGDRTREASRSSPLPGNPHNEGAGAGRHVPALVPPAPPVRMPENLPQIGLGSRGKRPLLPLPHHRPRIFVPCSDWGVSGVNSVLEALGHELELLGWDLEILFTRDREFAFGRDTTTLHVPSLPYTLIDPTREGLTGMWEATIAHLERNAPCIVLTAYDFAANSVIPALSDAVGAVLWVQADDADYYEQAYRLGRYCNELVCVSDQIRQRVVELNPAFATRANVIYNTSIRATDVKPPTGGDPNRVRLLYTGRLVQYQKRVLDFVNLADALDSVGIDYELSLIGAFSSHERDTERLFLQRAAEHMADGRIRLLGRLPRERVLHELSSHHLFILLSDFEGMPLAVVEAMSRGCVPVVAASDSGIPEIVTNNSNGLIIEGRDYAQWAKAINSLWRDPLRRALMSDHARRTVLDRFTTEKVVREFDALFSRVAAALNSGAYSRPRALVWSGEPPPCGDVLPPPSLFIPTTLPGLK